MAASSSAVLLARGTDRSDSYTLELLVFVLVIIIYYGWKVPDICRLGERFLKLTMDFILLPPVPFSSLSIMGATLIPSTLMPLFPWINDVPKLAVAGSISSLLFYF